MKIILATGGSGGHIFPALKTAQRLRAQGHEVLFAGALRFAEDRLKQAGFPLIMLNVEGLNTKSLSGIFLFSFLMVKSIIHCFGMLRSFKPDAVAGFGSYSSFPVIFAACMLGIPTIVHEQNVVPGKANKLSFRFARRIAVTFEETKKYISGRDVIRTGCPCNDVRSPESKDALLKKFNLHPGRTTLLVLGGSQGSRALNEIFFEAVPYLQAERDIQVIHMTGRTDYSLYAEKYLKLKVPSYVCPFLENIQDAYSVADAVVARSGAGTVCEIAAFGLPSIFVPYPFAQGHQKANAAVLERAGVAVIIDQKDLTRSKLVETIGKFMTKDLTPSAVREKIARDFVENPTEQLSSAIVSLKQ